MEARCGRLDFQSLPRFFQEMAVGAGTFPSRVQVHLCVNPGLRTPPRTGWGALHQDYEYTHLEVGCVQKASVVSLAHALGIQRGGSQSCFQSTT